MLYGQPTGLRDGGSGGLGFWEPAAVDLEGCDITIAQKHKLKLLLEKYRDVFKNSDDEVGRTHRTQFHKHTKNHEVLVACSKTP